MSRHKPVLHPLMGLLAIGSAVTSFGTRHAAADVTSALYLDDEFFTYRVEHMPDLDQRRAEQDGWTGLPGNGSMYCVPTACMNVMIYMANHGFPEVTPGSGSWQFQATYNAASDNIRFLGILMGTSASSGTGGGGWQDGQRFWLQAYDKFTVSAYYLNDNYTPTHASLTKTAVDGSLVTLAYGRYDLEDVILGAPHIGDRSGGGHVVTLARSKYFAPNERVLEVRDPADDPDNGTNPNYLTTQSWFGNRSFDTDHRLVWWGPSLTARFVTTLNYLPTNSRVAIVDGYVGVRPKEGYSFINTGVGYSLVVFLPYLPVGFPSQQFTSFDLPAAVIPSDIQIAPDLVDYFVVCEGDADAGLPAALGCLDGITGEFKMLADVTNATELAIGRNRNIYILADDRVHCIDPALDGAPIIATANLPSPGQAIAYDDATDEVVVLSLPEALLMRYPSDLPPDVEPSITSLPGDIADADTATLAIAPSEGGPGVAWLATDASSTLYGAMEALPGGGPMIHEVDIASIAAPTGIDFDDAGHMYVATEERIVELMLAGTDWSEVAVDEQEFAGFDVGGMFRTTRSRSNYDPALHEAPNWVNIDPDELTFGDHIPDCLADFNHDRVVDVQDLLALLGGWGPCDICVADVDGDRVVAVTDLLEMLGAWGDCPE